MKRMRVVGLLVGLFSLDIGAMQRAQSLMRVAKPLVQQVPGTRVYGFSETVRKLLRNLDSNPHIQLSDRKKVVAEIQTLALKEFNILDPSQIPLAVDISNAMMHEQAPVHLKEQYLLTNYATLFNVPSVSPQEHDSKLYQKVLQVSDWKKSPYFPRKALEMGPTELRKFIEDVSSKVCQVPCSSCKDSQELIASRLTLYQAIMNQQ